MLRALLITVLLAVSGWTQAEQTKKVGEVSVHYNAFNSASLTPEIAKQYQISRSGNQGVLTMSVKTEGTKSEKWLLANISGKARNLLGQSTDLTFKEIKEGIATYYITSFRFDDKDHLTFDLVVAPETGASIPVTFTQQFFMETK